MKKLLIVLALLSLGACSSGQGSFSRFNNAFGTGTFPVANDGEAALYIVRQPAQPDAPPINITVGSQPIVGLTAPNYIRLDLKPKLYDLRAYGTQKSSELIITVAAGQTRFLLAQPTADGSAELLELSQEQGRRLARAGERQWTPQLYY
ncbi:hypothetical protein [Reyranella sp.]|uniref:hypothetical protein n=1 Tax=Reyranella sp. TaxID=1929291 RepID=UPI003BA8677A